MKARGAILLAALVLALATPGSTFAAVFDCPAGDVPCLIASIDAANGNPGADTINLAAGSYILLDPVIGEEGDQTGLPSIESTVTIRGAGANATAIERESVFGFRILRIGEGGNLTLDSLTIRNGSLGGLGGGGGIYNAGTTTILDSIIADNHVELGPGGGAIRNDNVLILRGSRVTDNIAVATNGGGISNAGILTVEHSFILRNASDGPAGIAGGTVTIENSTIADNVSFGTGGIDVANLTVKNSTIAGNRSTEFDGGGIRVVGSATIENSTIVGNHADNTLPPRAGGGIRVGSGGSLLISNSTVVDNSAGGFGGGLYNEGGTIQLRNTIVARNTLPPPFPGDPPPEGPDCFGPVTSVGHNLVGNTSGCTIVLLESDLTGDPGLGSLQDDGTPGNGHVPLLATSQAIDAGESASCTLTDQLGHSRIDGDGDGFVVCDIGAIEFSPAATLVNDLVSLAPLATAYDPAPVPGGPAGTFTITATFTNTSADSIHDPFFNVTQLSGGNLLLNADGGPGGVGASLTPDVGLDAILSPGESFTAQFVVGLQKRSAFTFFVELLGVAGP